MRTRIHWLIAGAALVIAGCEKDEVVAPTPVKSGEFATSALHGITNADWTLVRMDGGEGAVPMARNAPWFRLGSRTQEVSGNTGCNALTARYDLAGTRLVFDRVAHTRMLCPDLAATEEQFVNVLNNTTNYRLENGLLVLMRADEKLAWLKGS